MVDTQIKWHKDLPHDIVVIDASHLSDIDTTGIFEDSRLLVIDNIDWGDLDEIRAAVPLREREFKTSFTKTPIPKKIIPHLRIIARQFNDLFLSLYPNYWATEVTSSFRPMITNNEPMHFDTFELPHPAPTAFLNFDTKPRIWRTSYTIQALCEKFPAEMRGLVERVEKERQVNAHRNLSSVLRKNTLKDWSPLDSRAPYHEIHFPQGSVVICNPKNVSHQIYYGRGAYGYSWHLDQGGGLLQEEIVDQCLS